MSGGGNGRPANANDRAARSPGKSYSPANATPFRRFLQPPIMKTCPSCRVAAAVLGVLLASIAGGCASYEIKVDAIKRPGRTDENLISFNIQNRNPAIEGDSLRHKELAGHIRTALSGHGWWEAPNANSAAMIVEVAYGIEPPRMVYDRVAVPVFEPDAEKASRTSSGTRLGPTVPNGKELVGFEHEYFPVVVREKHLSVTCRENKVVSDGRPPEEIWRVSVSIEDESKDLRGYLPILASAVMEQIGRNTSGVVAASMGRNDDAIGFIRKGL